MQYRYNLVNLQRPLVEHRRPSNTEGLITYPARWRCLLIRMIYFIGKRYIFIKRPAIRYITHNRAPKCFEVRQVCRMETLALLFLF
jgi:hypothetical protein